MGGRKGTTLGKLVATYVYRDEIGKYAYEVRRHEPKTFRQGRKNRNGRWVPGLQGVKALPYRLPELLAAAKKGKRVYLVEGEKDAETLAALGYSTTCHRSASGVFQKAWLKYFSGCSSVVIIADKDEAGRRNAQRAYGLLKTEHKVRIYECKRGKDITAHLEAGGRLKGGLTDVTLAVGADMASNGQAGATAPRHNGWSAVALAEWALAKLQEDAAEGENHAGRAKTAWDFAEQLRDVPRELATEAMRLYVQNCPAYDSDGEPGIYPMEGAMDTLRSALDGPTPEGWTPGPFSKPPKNEELDTVVHRIRINREAKRVVDVEEMEAQFREAPSMRSAVEFLQVPDEDLKYTIQALHPTGGNTVIEAQYKAGKTTLLLNLLRSLVDEVAFLGELHTWRDGPVAFWNYELSEIQFRKWLRRMDLKHPENAAVWNLRGYRLPLEVPYVEDLAVEWLGSRNVKTLIIDPFARAYYGNENDNSEVGRWLETLDVIKERSGVQDLMMAVHFGRGFGEEGGERGRGAARLDDWADVRWVMTIQDDVRYFRADGRDVEFRERSLDFDRERSLLRLMDGNRKSDRLAAVLDEDIQVVVKVVTRSPGIKSSGIYEHLTGRKQRKVSAVAEAIDRGLISARHEGGEVHHYLIT